MRRWPIGSASGNSSGSLRTSPSVTCNRKPTGTPAQLLDERRSDREAGSPSEGPAARAALEKAGITAEIGGRPKHISSIWKKMQKKGLDFSSLYDIRALRVLVPDVPSCYAALGGEHGPTLFLCCGVVDARVVARASVFSERRS